MLKPLFETTEALAPQPDDELQWFVMRSGLGKRLGPGGKRLYGWEAIEGRVYQRFIPMKEHVRELSGRKKRVVAPVANDLIFVRDTYQRALSLHLGPDSITFRYVKGAPYQQPLTVRDADMDNFIEVCRRAGEAQLLAAADLAAIKAGDMVRVNGGPFDGCIGRVVTVRGSRRRRLLVQIADLAILVNLEQIQSP